MHSQHFNCRNISKKEIYIFPLAITIISMLTTPIVPKYEFQAQIRCTGTEGPLDDTFRVAQLEALEALLPTGWSRDEQQFTKLVEVAGGDLGLAEDEFLTALASCMQTHLTDGLLSRMTVKFNSTTVSMFDTPSAVAV